MIKAWFQALRPHQWVKNLFVLAPLVFAERLLDSNSLSQAAVALGFFCAISSAVYLFNDLMDREVDRRHPLKKNRPIASGRLSVTAASISVVVLASISLGMSFAFSRHLGLILVTYFSLNLIYSWKLKHVVIMDVMIVSLGFLFRVLAGAAAVGVAVSSWLLLCTLFLSLFLVFSKRRHELLLLEEDASAQRKVLEHYSPAFLDQMINVVTASTVLSYALWTMDPETVERFGHQKLIYSVPLVLFGIFRYLYLMHQKEEENNPTEALLKDFPFLANLVIWGFTMIGIIYLN